MLSKYLQQYFMMHQKYLEIFPERLFALSTGESWHQSAALLSTSKIEAWDKNTPIIIIDELAENVLVQVSYFDNHVRVTH